MIHAQFNGWLKIAAGSILSGLLAFSCAKPGPGGDIELSLSVRHHQFPIPSAIVYIKYGASEFPGSDKAVYDHTVQTGSNGHAAGHAHVKELKPGQYYFYAEGFDSSITETVSGGTGLFIQRRERRSTIEVDIPVTE